MDPSEKYQRMCMDAKKYLPRHQYTVGDFYYDENMGVVRVASDPWGTRWPCVVDTPILRQDQLQQLAFTDYDSLSPVEMIYQIYYLMCCCTDNGFDLGKYCEQFTSMEQLWLAFVMHEKFNKVWDDKDNQWVLQT